MASQRKKKKKAGKILYYGLLCLFAAVFIGSAIYVGSYVAESLQAAREYNKLQQELEEHRATMPSRPAPTMPVFTEPVPTEPSAPTIPSEPEQPTEPTEPTEPAAPQILPEFLDLYQQNPDLIGWIEIPGTGISYPVMQTPGRPDFYLRRGFDKEYSRWGCIYVREACDVFAPSDNLVIYGHHMRDGSMFAALDHYKTKSFWEEHPLIYFDTLYERHTYMVFSTFKTSANFNEGYPYHRFNNAANQEEFDTFIRTIKGMEFFDTGITPPYGSKLITLSTCEDTLDNGRFVVVAVQVA